MLSRFSPSAALRRRTAEAFRAVRTYRGLRQADVAQAMGVSLRTYLQIEAGKARVTIDQLLGFCAATDCDRQAMFAAAAGGRPEFAVVCTGNKLMTVALLAAENLHHDVGDELGALSSPDVVALIQTGFDALAAEVRRHRVNRARLEERFSGDDHPGEPEG